MAPSFVERIRKGWNAFAREAEQPFQTTYEQGYPSSSRPDRVRLSSTNQRSIIAPIYTRLSIDTARASIRHVMLDDQKRYTGDINSGLNNCLTVEANIDQGAQHFRQDIATKLFDIGVVAIVPVDVSNNPLDTTGFDIQTLRVGEIVQWYPRSVRVKVYNDRKGDFEELTLPKRVVAIVENPLYAVMNEANSTLQRLIRKLNLLDAVDEQSSSGKLDIIIQLPYTIRTDVKRKEAEQRRKDIEEQLRGSQYGIAYVDGTERITQLNRPSENNLLKQVEYLTNLLYSQLGLTTEVFDGTADEKTMLNYFNRTVDPVLVAIVEGMKRVFLSKTARTQGQSVEYFRDPFKLVAVGDMAELADKFTRNEVLTPNEVRSIIGFKPVQDPKADELRNRNLPQQLETPVDDIPEDY